MKKITKTYYFLDEEDKKNIKQKLALRDWEIKDLSNALGLSLSYTSTILSGKRSLTNKIIEQFAGVGIKLDIGE